MYSTQCVRELLIIFPICVYNLQIYYEIRHELTMNEQANKLMNVYDYINFQVFSYISEPTHQEIVETIPVAKGQSSKQTMADDGTDMNATKELCDPLSTTHERK